MSKQQQSGAEERESPLKRLREELGLSQEEFARIIGTSVRTVGRWEAGVSMATFTVPQMKALVRLLTSSGKSLEDFPDDLGPAGRQSEKV